MDNGMGRFEAGMRVAASAAWFALGVLAVEMARAFGRGGQSDLAYVHLAVGVLVAVVAAHSGFNNALRWLRLRARDKAADGRLWTGQCRVEGDQLVARVSLRALPGILAGAAGPMGWGGHEPEVVDLKHLAELVALELGEYPISHDRDDRTLFQRALDSALLGALETGDACLRLPDDPEGGDL